VEATLERLFSTATSDLHRLVDADPVVARLNAAHSGIRPVLQHDLFTALVRSISAQQINLRWAATIRARLAERYGDRHAIAGEFVYRLNPERLASAAPSDIRALQFTNRKAESIVALAQEFAQGSLSLNFLEPLSDEEIIARLIKLRGIGLWSAEWILCRTLGRPRVVAGDLGVRKAIGHIYLNGAMPSEADVRGLTSHWGPSASIAQALSLHAYAVGTE
jgi:DNA-3-methyladenine glycosylase II